MDDACFAELLDRLVAHTGAARYREWFDPTHPAALPEPEWASARESVRRMARGLGLIEGEAGTPAEVGGSAGARSDVRSPVPVAMQAARIAAVKACPHWSKAGCGCSGGTCSAGKGHPTTGEVGYGECFECLGV